MGPTGLCADGLDVVTLLAGEVEVGDPDELVG
jgi:hypothetical protein